MINGPNESMDKYSQAAEFIAVHQWGWTDPPKTVINEALIHAKAKEERLRTLEIMVELNLITPEIMHRVLESQKQAPPNERGRSFELAAELSGNKALLLDDFSRVLAPTKQVQYINQIDMVDIQPHRLMSEPLIASECERLNAVLVTIQERTPTLVFSSFDDEYIAFKQLGRTERLNNPILSQLDDDEKSSLILAVSRPDIVAKARTISTGSTSGESEASIVKISTLRSDDIRPERKVLAAIFSYATTEGATDIHIDPSKSEKNIPTIFKVNGQGVLGREDITLSHKNYQNIKQYLINISAAAKMGASLTGPADGYFLLVDEQGKRYNIRCSFIPDGDPFSFSSQLVSIMLRVIAQEEGAVELESMNVPQRVRELIKRSVMLGNGATYICGPTGSGKSTTLFGSINEHVKAFGTSKTRLSFEDPVERQVPHIMQIQLGKEAHRKYDNPYEPYQKAMLRHSPNLILFGEVRDGNSAIAVASASATGHSVLTTLHATTPSTAIERLLNMIPPQFKQMVIQNLNVVIGQRLVGKLCDSCKVQRPITDDERNLIEYALEKSDQTAIMNQLPEELTFKNPSGCRACSYRGVKGVSPVYEVVDLMPTHKRQLYQDNADYEAIISTAREFSLQESALDLVMEGQADIYAFLEM